MHNLVKASLNVDDRTHKMDGDRVVAAGSDDVIPELLALFGGPGIRALVDGDDKLRGLLEEIEEAGFTGFHLELSAEGAGTEEGHDGEALYHSLTRRNVSLVAKAIPGRPNISRRNEIMYWPTLNRTRGGEEI